MSHGGTDEDTEKAKKSPRAFWFLFHDLFEGLYL